MKTKPIILSAALALLFAGCHSGSDKITWDDEDASEASAPAPFCSEKLPSHIGRFPSFTPCAAQVRAGRVEVQRFAASAQKALDYRDAIDALDGFSMMEVGSAGNFNSAYTGGGDYTFVNAIINANTNDIRLTLAGERKVKLGEIEELFPRADANDTLRTAKSWYRLTDETDAADIFDKYRHALINKGFFKERDCIPDDITIWNCFATDGKYGYGYRAYENNSTMTLRKELATTYQMPKFLASDLPDFAIADSIKAIGWRLDVAKGGWGEVISADKLQEFKDQLAKPESEFEFHEQESYLPHGYIYHAKPGTRYDQRGLVAIMDYEHYSSISVTLEATDRWSTDSKIEEVITPIENAMYHLQLELYFDSSDEIFDWAIGYVNNSGVFEIGACSYDYIPHEYYGDSYELTCPAKKDGYQYEFKVIDKIESGEKDTVRIKKYRRNTI